MPKEQLFNNITAVNIALPYNIENKSQIVDIACKKCQSNDQHLISILYNDQLVVLLVSYTSYSIINHVYIINLNDLSITVDRHKSKIKFADEINIIILDSQNQLWICNFFTGSICGSFNTNGQHCVAFVNSIRTIILLYESSMDLLSFPGMEKIETFAVGLNSLLFPFSDDQVDTILLLENSTIDQYKIVLKSISRLDAAVRLREIIGTGNYEQAKHFAIMYKLPQQDIYVAEMKHLIAQIDNTRDYVFSNEFQLKILKCVEEINDFFDFDVFVDLMLITMSSLHHENFLLTKLMIYAKRHNHTESGKKFYNMIELELGRFSIFQLMYSAADYNSNKWKSFRNIDNLSILFSAMEICSVSTIIHIWRQIKNNMTDIFTINNTTLCQKLINLGKRIINKRSDPQEFARLFDWMNLELIEEQIQKAPEQLEFLIDVINRVVRDIEATRDKRYRQMCIDKLKLIILNLTKPLCNSNPVSRAHAEAARLVSCLEQVNTVYSLSNLCSELIQLENLFKNYNLDLSLDVFKNETPTQLAMRFLDQVSNTELQDGIVWNKLDNLLVEFNVRPSEFYHGYIYDKLVNKLSSKNDSAANESSGEYSMIFFRFSILLEKIQDKQIQLQCLEAFASRADVPLKIQLNILIDKHVAKSHPNNPVVVKLKHIQRRSRIYPICTRYGQIYNSKSFKPENLLWVILRAEIDCDAQNSTQHKADITSIAKEFSLSDIVVLELRCSILIEDIFQNDYRAYETLSRLSLLLKDPKLPKDIRNRLVHSSFSEFYTMLCSICDMNFETMECLCEVGSSLASRYTNIHMRDEWIRVFNTIRLCLDMTQELYDNRVVPVIDLLVGYRVSDMEWERVRMNIVGYSLSRELISQLTTSDTRGGREGYLKLRDKVCHSIKSWNVYCSRKFQTRDDIFMEMIANQLVSLVRRFMDDRDYGTATRAIYCALEVILEFVGQPGNISHFSRTISDIIGALVLVADIPGNIFIICHILEAYSKLISLYVYANLKYLSKQFNNLQLLVLFIQSFLASFVSFDKPEEICDFSKLDRNMYQEKPVSLNSFEHFIVLIRHGLAAISSFDYEFESAISTFRMSLFSAMPKFLDVQLYITGYLSGLSLLTQISDESNIDELKSLISIQDTTRIITCRQMMQKRVIDINLIVSLLLQCTPKIAQQELTTLIRKCKSRKFLLQLYSIGVLVLLHYRDTDVSDRSLVYTTMTKEVRKKLWSMKLSDLNITLKAGDIQELKIIKLELFRHPNVSVEFVKEFLNDFQFFEAVNYFDFFCSIFMVSFIDCDDINSYKLKVEKVLSRAEEVWAELPKDAKYIEESIARLSQIIPSISPYHYELIEYLYGKMAIYVTNYQCELDILKLLYSYIRTSDIDQYEAQLCQSMAKDYGMDNPMDAKYLSSLRLPFHLLLRENPMLIIAPQLNDTNLLMWHDMYHIIDRMSSISRTVFNTDMLHEITAKNIVDRFIVYNNLTKSHENRKHVFMGNLYQSSSCWFEKTLLDMDFVLEDLLVNQTYIVIVRYFMDHLVVGEQLLALMKRAISWIDRKMGQGLCNSMLELTSWRSQLVSDSRCLEIEEILSISNLYREDHLEYISDHRMLMEQILFHERLSFSKIPTAQLGKIIAVLIKIAEKADIDIHEFAISFVKVHLKLVSSFHESLSCDETDMSILNASTDMSMDTSLRADKEQSEILDMTEMEILSQDKSIKYSIKDSLFEHVRENSVSLDQWNNILQFLFRTFRPCEDDTVNELCTSHWYSMFLVMLELNNMKLLRCCPSNESGVGVGISTIVKRLREFQLHDKTGLIKQLYRMHTTLETKYSDIIKNLFDLFPNTIDSSDPEIDHIRKRLFMNTGLNETIDNRI